MKRVTMFEKYDKIKVNNYDLLGNPFPMQGTVLHLLDEIEDYKDYLADEDGPIEVYEENTYDKVRYPHTLDKDGNILFKTSQRLIEGIREAWCINTQETCRVGYISFLGGKMYVRQYDKGWSWDVGEIRY